MRVRFICDVFTAIVCLRFMSTKNNTITFAMFSKIKTKPICNYKIVFSWASIQFICLLYYCLGVHMARLYILSAFTIERNISIRAIINNYRVYNCLFCDCHNHKSYTQSLVMHGYMFFVYRDDVIMSLKSFL